MQTLLFILLGLLMKVGAQVQCSFKKDTELLDGDLTLRQYVNQEEETVTIQLVYQGQGWVSIAFSDGMLGSEAVVGLPDEDEVATYYLGGYLPFAVSRLEDELQDSLIDPSIVQTDTETILTFTQSVRDELGNVVVAGGETSSIIYAVGMSNELGFHGFWGRGKASISFDYCVSLSPKITSEAQPSDP